MSGSIAPSVLVACDDLLLLDEVIRHLEEIPQWRLVSPARSAEELLHSAETLFPDIVIVSDRVAIELAGAFNAGQLQAGIVVFSRMEEPETLRAALKVAAQGFVLWPQERAQLKSLVERGMVTQATNSSAAGNLHSVWAPKGGAGATVIAAHLAASIARLPQDSLLVDLDLENADQTSLLQADAGAKSILDLIRVGDEVTADMVRSVAWTNPEGFRVILSPGKFGESALVKPSDIGRLLRTVREVAGHVVADLPSGLGDTALSVLEESSSIVLVLTPDLLGLRRAREAVKVLRSVGIDTNRIHAVLNQAGGVDVSPRDVEQVLEVPKVTRINADFRIYRSTNRGELSVRCLKALVPLARRLGNLQSVGGLRLPEAVPAPAAQADPLVDIAQRQRAGRKLALGGRR